MVKNKKQSNIRFLYIKFYVKFKRLNRIFDRFFK